MELIAVKIDTLQEDIIVATLYMAPQTSAWNTEEHKDLAGNAIQCLRTLSQQMEDKSERIILTGDFNGNINCWQRRCREPRKLLEPKTSRFSSGFFF